MSVVPSAKHQFILEGHGYVARLLCNVTVYDLALASTKLCWLMTETHGCEELAHSGCAEMP